MTHHDNLEFLEDIIPKTTSYRDVKGKAAAARARLKGEKSGGPGEDDQSAEGMPNGKKPKGIMNGKGSSPSANGFVTVYPCDESRPNASNVNYVTNVNIPNLVLAKPSADGEVCLYTSQATHLLVDVSGNEQPEPVVQPERLRRQPGAAREHADGQELLHELERRRRGWMRCHVHLLRPPYGLTQGQGQGADPRLNPSGASGR